MCLFSPDFCYGPLEVVIRFTAASMAVGHWRPRMPSSSIRRDLSLDDTLQVLRGSSMMVVGSKEGQSPNRLLPMRTQYRGCCLSPWAVPEDSGRYDLSSAPGRTGEMRLTVVAARAQCAEFLTQRHILSMKRGNDQKLALIARRAQGIGSGPHPESDFENTSKLFIFPGIKTVAPCSVLSGKPLRLSLHSSRCVSDVRHLRL
jgi:hypothetical protein